MIRVSENTVECEVTYESLQQVEKAALAFVCAVLNRSRSKLLPSNRFKVHGEDFLTHSIMARICSTKYYLNDELVTVVPTFSVSTNTFSIYLMEEDVCDE